MFNTYETQANIAAVEKILSEKLSGSFISLILFNK
jgi:hypothetical protein